MVKHRKIPICRPQNADTGIKRPGLTDKSVWDRLNFRFEMKNKGKAENRAVMDRFFADRGNMKLFIKKEDSGMVF